MDKITLSVPNITCDHCILTIRRELSDAEGVVKVEGDVDKKEITVEWKAPANLEKIKSTLEDINYPTAD